MIGDAMRSAHAPKACITDEVCITHAVRITFRKERITQKSLFCLVDKRDFFVGASGDTELFEKASNINGFQGGRVANNLYISLFSGDCFSDSRPFSIPKFKCCD